MIPVGIQWNFLIYQKGNNDATHTFDIKKGSLLLYDDYEVYCSNKNRNRNNENAKVDRYAQ